MLIIKSNFAKNLLAVALWTTLIGTSLIWNIYDNKSHVLELAAISARENFNKDQAFRQWGALHGGVYVPIDERTPPNPALAHIPNRDVITNDGQKLTLMNPAYMLRQMMNEYAELYGIKGKITGRVLLNPINAPDTWELKALDEFEEGVKEVKERADIEGKPYLRLMRPMVMKPSCMKCHGHLGFKVGDIRGGVGVSIPLTPYLENASNSVIVLWLGHAIIWLLGVIAIFVFLKYKREHILDEQKKYVLKQEVLHAEKANLAKSEFLSRMSHELRTPLNAILGFCQMLELDNSNFNHTQKGNVKEILGAGEHLLSLINEVLDLARIESGKLDVNMEVVNLNETLQECFALIKPSLDEKQIEVIDEIDNQQFNVKMDAFRLKQILLNLLSNAVKYNIKKGRITLKYNKINDNYVRLSIIDTGEGLSCAEISMLFTPFERLNAKENVEGTGIGLTITKNLVELMGGSIGVESTKGEGCIFWVEFKLS